MTFSFGDKRRCSKILSSSVSLEQGVLALTGLETDSSLRDDVSLAEVDFSLAVFESFSFSGVVSSSPEKIKNEKLRSQGS